MKQKKCPFRVGGLILALVLLVLGSALYAEYNPAKSHDDLLAQAAGNHMYNTQRIMVKANSYQEAKQIAQANDLKVLKDFKALSNKRGQWYGVFAKKSGNTFAIEQIVDNLKKTPGIIYAGFDYELSICQTPNDPKFSELWGMHNTGQTGGTADADIDAPEAWDLATGSSSVIVAVIDTGVDYNHTDLSPNMWHNPGEIAGNGIDDDGNGYIDDIYGIDGCNNDSDPYDDHYHGTHCAGTIGAKGNDGFGVVGVNWDVKIMALKFLNSSGSGSTSDAVECMNYLIDQRQKGQNIVVASNSWGGGGADQALLDAINTAGNLGVLFAAAAGNNSSNNDSTPFYPANYDSQYIISVAATDHNDQLASFSNYGANTVELGAPGVSIVSDSPGGGFRTLNGTSMATPHVSGTIGLLASIFPSDSPIQRKNRILNYVDPIPALSGKTITGGRLNIFKAVQSAPFVIAKFSVAKQGDLTRVFTDESTANYCTITGWNWDFGDGQSSIQQNPTHTYAAAGNYNVTLTVTADTGANDSETKTVWAGPNQLPTANFSYADAGGFNVNFTDQSTDPDGTITQWYWQFGDGGTATTKNPNHHYQYPGTYNVTLTATDNEGGSDAITKLIEVELSYCASSASSANAVAITKVEIGSFANSSAKSTYSDFMNLTVNMNQNQTYNVTITTDSTFWQGNVRIWIDYNLDGDFTEANEKVMENYGKGTITGSFTVPSGTVTGQGVGLRVSMKQASYREPCAANDGWGEVEDYTAVFNAGGNQPPTANFTYTINGLTANFTDTSTDSDGTITAWSWNFGDGGTSTQRNPSHTYTAAGTYTVTLTVTDDDGATDPESKSVTVSAPSNQPPTANFTYTTNNLTVNFTDTSTDSDGTITAWSWNFGDGGTSTQQNPSHTYAAAGTYTVTLTVTDDDGATDPESKSITVSDGGTMPTYCASSSSSFNTGYITQVVVGSFSNSSSSSYYTNFTNLTVNLTKGNSYSVSLTPYMSSTIWNGYWRIWIDYNRDGDFTDAGEKVFENYMNSQKNGQPITGSFTVPTSGVVTGQKTGMRVSFKISSYRDACQTNTGWGEVEDYAVIIQ